MKHMVHNMWPVTPYFMASFPVGGRERRKERGGREGEREGGRERERERVHADLHFCLFEVIYCYLS